MEEFKRNSNFKCPKCGWGVSKRRYCEGTKVMKKKADGTLEAHYSCVREVEGEHMHVLCDDCGFDQQRKLPKTT